MTLRGRLTTAFLAMVLGPVLLGSLFVGLTVAAMSRDRTVERLDHASTTVRTAIGAQCRQLQAVADSVAVLPIGSQGAAAGQLQGRGLASIVRVGGSGDPGWRDCGAPADGSVTAIVARAQSGSVTVYAAQALDAGFVTRLAASSGAEVTLLAGDARGAGAVQSTLRPRDQRAVSWAAGRSRPTATGFATVRTRDGKRYVRRLPTAPGQPLPLVVSARGGDPVGLSITLVIAVLTVAAAAVVVARWLARSTTRPLAELAEAADRVADGDLDTRVPVHRPDEVGRLAGSFNRMTRELQAYVQALTAGRDQLRGHLAILGDTLSSTHDLQRILQVILQTARCGDRRPGRGGAAHRPGRRHARRALRGGSARDLPARVPLADGVLGAVAATGEPQRGARRGRQSPDVRRRADLRARGARRPAGRRRAGRGSGRRRDHQPGRTRGARPVRPPGRGRVRRHRSAHAAYVRRAGRGGRAQRPNARGGPAVVVHRPADRLVELPLPARIVAPRGGAGQPVPAHARGPGRSIWTTSRT